jgi:hypothetical protein
MTISRRSPAARGARRLPVSQELEDLVDLDARLRLLAAVSGDSYRLAVGQALDTVAALLDAHAGTAGHSSVA